MILTRRVLLGGALCFLGAAVASVPPARGECLERFCCEFTQASAECGNQHGIKFVYVQWQVNVQGCSNSYINIYRRCEGQTPYNLIEQVEVHSSPYVDECPIRCPGSDSNLEYRLELVCPESQDTTDNVYVNSARYCCD